VVWEQDSERSNTRQERVLDGDRVESGPDGLRHDPTDDGRSRGDILPRQSLARTPRPHETR